MNEYYVYVDNLHIKHLTWVWKVLNLKNIIWFNFSSL